MAQTATHEEVVLQLVGDGRRVVVAYEAQGVAGKERAHLAQRIDDLLFTTALEVGPSMSTGEQGVAHKGHVSRACRAKQDDTAGGVTGRCHDLQLDVSERDRVVLFE